MTQRLGPHPCPRCGVTIRRAFVACYPCWQVIPIDLRRPVTIEYAKGAGSMAHVRAVAAARQWCRDNALS